MSLREKILIYLRNPHPVYEDRLTHALVENKWHRLANEKRLGMDDYSIASFIMDGALVDLPEKAPLFDGKPGMPRVVIELPQFQYLSTFYNECGLVPLSGEDVFGVRGAEKIRRAFAIMESVPELSRAVSELIRSIQLLKSENEEFDISHSDPAVPFSIFVSVGKSEGIVADLRICESILHEAMHLKLTLIEENVNLVVSGTTEQYHSPWRGENRPVRGVLHGLFVFRAIHDFYKEILSMAEWGATATEFAKDRIFSVEEEISIIKHLHLSQGLTEYGCQLAKSLIISGN
jgi:hypothetical protein